MSKDLFSNQARAYALYRPTYPDDLFTYIVSFVHEKRSAWDCATGNGQAAIQLAKYFDIVEATDLSTEQLEQAIPHQKIRYQKCSAEEPPFADNSFDLITVATAYHWLNWPLFHQEAVRVGKTGGVVAAWSYYTLQTNDPELNELYQHLYHNITGPYWEAERRYVDEQYRTVPFDFTPLPVKQFEVHMEWTKEQFTGYLSTWSATQKYIKLKSCSPVDSILPALHNFWKDGEKRTITFPLCLRLGTVSK